ncbi:MAG: oligosaccharide flippase family protein [candidate division SR1 bacterium]|nr:oligosaccharide flippase family protein [candidate division SR1 bacterium]
MVSSHRLVIKDAAWQLMSRIISAVFGFVTTKIMASYLGSLRYGDYNSILKYFAFRTALADLGLYVLAVKRLGELKEKCKNDPDNTELKSEYGKFVATRIVTMVVIYAVAIGIAYMIPSYRANPYYLWGLPFGLLFSASFMFAGIQQLPLQLFWKMEKLSITLITARLSQLVILLPVVYLLFKHVDFMSGPTTVGVIAFCLVLFSVVGSGIGQNIEIGIRSRRILPLKIIWDWKFIGNTIKTNRNYGVSYYLSSFHTLLPLLFLTWFYPTMSGVNYSGLRGLSLGLIEILLIIPSALGNSLLHNISTYSDLHKRKSLGSLLSLMIWFGCLFAVNFCVFADMVIRVTSDKSFMGSWDSIAHWGSNQLLPFLGIVLIFSFIKQVYNYVFVATGKQNVLLLVNGVGVFIGIFVGLYTIPARGFTLGWGLLGAVVTQMLMEILFTSGAIITGFRMKVSPILNVSILIKMLLIMCGFAVVGRGVTSYIHMTYLTFFVIAIILNGSVALISLPLLKKLGRGLTVEADVYPPIQ